MAPTITQRMTPLAQLVDDKLSARYNINLPTYLAIARIPGPHWKSYREVADDFAAITGRAFNRVTVDSYARTFGIPDTGRYATVNGKPVSLPAKVGADEVARYAEALYTGTAEQRGVVDLDEVLAHAVGQFEDVEEADSLRETLAVLFDPDARAQLKASAAEGAH